MNELKDNGSPLSKIKKELPFKVPDGYFEDFQARLNTGIHTRTVTAKSGKYRLMMRPYMAAAVLLVVALAAGTMVFRTDHRNRAYKRFHAEISRTVEQELYSISEETIIETLATDQTHNQVQIQVNSDDMINYLLHEDLSEEELLDAL